MADAGSELRPLYAVLGVEADASANDIRQAYRRLALEHHPDRVHAGKADAAANSDMFAGIALAYEVLGHEQRRKRYDLSGELPQTDVAVGRGDACMAKFLEEYVHSAPKVAHNREATSADMSLHSLHNYEVMEVSGRDVPEYMRKIVMVGVAYLASVVPDLPEREVVLLRHFVMDQMYALLAYSPPLDQDAFSKHGYIITYYDNPLQPGISATWSDQNRLGDLQPHPTAKSKVIDEETMEQRRLAALEWHGGSDASAAKTKPEPITVVPGSGKGPERIEAAIRVLISRESDIGSWAIKRLRSELEPLLGLAEGGLSEVGTSKILGVFMSCLDETADDGPDCFFDEEYD